MSVPDVGEWVHLRRFWTPIVMGRVESVSRSGGVSLDRIETEAGVMSRYWRVFPWVELDDIERLGAE